MSGQNENIDRTFREKLLNYSKLPPEIVWKRIEKDLGHKRRKNVIPFYFKIAAGIALFSGIAGLIYMLSNSGNPINEQSVSPAQNLIVNSSKSEILNASENMNSSLKAAFSANKKKTAVYTRSDATIKGQTKKDQQNIVEEGIDTTKNYFVATKSDLYDTAKSLTLTNQVARFEPSNNIYNDRKIENSTSKNIQDINPANKTGASILDKFLSEETEESRKPLKWSAGGEFGPQYSYRDIISNATYTDLLNKNESPLLAYAGGVHVLLEASRRISIQTGLYYSKMGNELNSINYESQAGIISDNHEINALAGQSSGNVYVIVNSTGTIVLSKKTYNQRQNYAANTNNDLATNNDYHASQTFEYVEVPLIMEYRIIARKLSFEIIGGLSSNFLINNSVDVSGPNNYTDHGTTEGVNKVNYSGTLGLGLEYPFGNKIQISLQPLFKYYLSSFYKDSQVEVHPYSIGIMTGINYKF